MDQTRSLDQSHHHLHIYIPVISGPLVWSDWEYMDAGIWTQGNINISLSQI